MDNIFEDTNLETKQVDLAQFDQDFAEAEVEANISEPIPDGKYEVIIKDVEVTTSKTSGNPMLKWTLRVLNPSQYRGRLLFRNCVIVSKENIKRIKKDLLLCGLQLTKLSELDTQIHNLLGITLQITKKKNGEFESVYFNKISKADPGQESLSTDRPF